MLDFPASPTVGQKYPTAPSAGMPVYTWDGEKWSIVPASGATTPAATFKATKNVDQAIATTIVKLLFQQEAYDIGGYYDPTLSRWTPPAGKPITIVAQGQIYPVTASVYWHLYVYKNGVQAKNSFDVTDASTTDFQLIHYEDIPNGTDYYEIWSGCSAGGSGTILTQWSFSGVQHTDGGGGVGTGIDPTRRINTQTGTTYTLALTDNGAFLWLANAAGFTLTIPPNSSVAFPIGTQIDLGQGSNGQVTIAPGAGVTIVSEGSRYKLAQQASCATLIKYGTDVWILAGSIAA